MSYSAEMVNSLFVEKLGSEEGRAKIAAYGGGVIRDHLRETSFARKVLPPQPITPAECQVSTEHDGLVKIEELEPESRAMVVDFRGSARARYIRAPRVAVSFFTIESEHFEKTEQELLAYKMPITKMIEEQSANDIQEIEDRQFLIYAEGGIQQMQASATKGVNGGANNEFSASKVNAGTVAVGPDQNASVMKGQLALAAGVDDYVVRPVTRPDFVNFFKMLTGPQRRLRMELVLLTEPDYDDILQWTIEDMGDRIQSETVVDGYKYNTLLGRRFIRTIKTDILRRGNIYGFTTPEFMGCFYVLNNTKFYVDKVGNKITFWSWEDIGMAFLNLNSLVKMELYSGAVTPSDDAIGWTRSAGAAVRLPSDEEDLGKARNPAEDGFQSPLVTQF
ncbi:MAG: hypothetical protein VXZ72_00005 [Chlamydiota bacterium]|nr:hypothetical protein [Chlamydiota bacterium]